MLGFRHSNTKLKEMKYLEIIGTRCLDEWDVFLDSVNRATIGAELARFDRFFLFLNALKNLPSPDLLPVKKALTNSSFCHRRYSRFRLPEEKRISLNSHYFWIVSKLFVILPNRAQLRRQQMLGKSSRCSHWEKPPSRLNFVNFANQAKLIVYPETY